MKTWAWLVLNKIWEDAGEIFVSADNPAGQAI